MLTLFEVLHLRSGRCLLPGSLSSMVAAKIEAFGYQGAKILFSRIRPRRETTIHFLTINKFSLKQTSLDSNCVCLYCAVLHVDRTIHTNTNTRGRAPTQRRCVGSNSLISSSPCIAAFVLCPTALVRLLPLGRRLERPRLSVRQHRRFI